MKYFFQVKLICAFLLSKNKIHEIIKTYIYIFSYMYNIKINYIKKIKIVNNKVILLIVLLNIYIYKNIQW